MMAFSPLFRSWHYVYSCFVNHQNLNTSKVIINMAKCTFSTQSSLGQNTKLEVEVEGQAVSDSETDVKPSKEDSKKTFLVVGLGNCDRREMRHSIGMQVLDRISKHFKLQWERENFMKSGGFVAKTNIAPGVELILLKPRVPMNINGSSVAKTARSYQVQPDNIYVIHDDMDKAVGTFQLKESGSAGGHNGVKSVIHAMRTKDIKRLRIGIDRPSSEDEVTEYVLSRFSFDQELAMLPAISSGVSSLFQHIGQQCNVELDVKLPTDPKSLQWNGMKITKPQKQNKHRQSKWDDESQFERRNYQPKHWDTPRNSGKYGQSRMNKWDDSKDSPRQRSFRYDNDSDSDDIQRQRKSRYDNFSQSDDFPRQRTSKSNHFSRHQNSNYDNFSESDNFPRQRNSKYDNFYESDDFQKQRASRPEDLDDFPRNRMSRSDNFSDSSDFRRHRQTSQRKSNDFKEAKVLFDDEWDDWDDLNDSSQKEDQTSEQRDMSSRRR